MESRKVLLSSIWISSVLILTMAAGGCAYETEDVELYADESDPMVDEEIDQLAEPQSGSETPDSEDIEIEGGSCTLGFCSQTWNNSGASVYIAKDWCWSSGTTGSTTTADPYCSTSSERMWVAPGGESPDGQDWDTFRVDAGWCYRVHFAEAEWYGLHEWDVTYNRAGQGTPFWVKVENNAIAIVSAQRLGSCP